MLKADPIIAQPLHSAQHPTVSVVIPVRDDAAFLATCLAALAAQTVRPHEVIVIDNGSTDQSAAVAGDAGAIVVFEPHPGIAVASAAGYDRATGDIIARLDSDSVPPPTWVDTITSYFGEHPAVDAITGAADFTDGPERIRRVAARVYLGAYFAAAALALSHVPLFGSNFAIRKNAWASIRTTTHTRNDDVHDDFDLSYHLGSRHRIRYIPALRLGISMRPLTAGGGRLRFKRGVRTVTIHWPHDLPWLRLTRRALLRARTEPVHTFRYVLALDALNVAAIIATTTLGRKRKQQQQQQQTTRASAVTAGTAVLGWGLAALAARTITPTESSAPSRRPRPAARRGQGLIRAGLTVNTVGCTVALFLLRSTSARPGRARALYLFAGGNVLSVMYLRLLRRYRRSGPRS